MADDFQPKWQGSRRSFFRWGAALSAAGAASLLPERTVRGHPMPTHDEAPHIDPPDYHMDERRITRGQRGSAMKPVYEPTPPPNAPRRPQDYDARFRIGVDIIEHEYLPGVSNQTLAFNGQVPGPELRVKEGDWVYVEFKNNTDLLHTIHWHGLFVPSNMDGVPYITQPPTMPGQTFIYKFRALPYGTHFYHCHFGTPLHMHTGMHGAFIVESEDDPIRKRFPYSREYVLIVDQIDTAFVRRELRRMVKRMKERVVLMKRNRMTDRILARFENVGEMMAAIRDGWIPPYRQSRNGPPHMPRPNIFTINGKAYPMTPVLKIRRDELIRIRMINVGSVEHYFHLHGHDFWEVCRDGAVLPHSFRANTIPITPGRTHDIVLEGKNPGVWTFHDHAVTRATNNGLYPGGALTTLVYEDFDPEYTPKVALDE